MPSIKSKIEDNLKEALKNRQELKVSILRLLLAEAHNQEIQKKKELSDDDFLTLLGQSAKRHEDSIQQFRQGEREDLATKEEEELKIIRSYLPPQLNESELLGLIGEAIAQASAGGGKLDLGTVMKFLMPKVKGRASGQKISELVKQELAKQTS